MTLNANHRAALLNALSEAKQELENAQGCMSKAKEEANKNSFEIRSFLAEQKIRLIEESIIGNDIDF